MIIGIIWVSVSISFLSPILNGKLIIRLDPAFGGVQISFASLNQVSPDLGLNRGDGHPSPKKNFDSENAEVL